MPVNVLRTLGCVGICLLLLLVLTACASSSPPPLPVVSPRPKIPPPPAVPEPMPSGAYLKRHCELIARANSTLKISLEGSELCKPDGPVTR